jgi:hypothetical protein
VPVVVDSVKRVLGTRLFSHVSQEVLKRVHPSVANGDASSSVIFRLRVNWIQAARVHVFPRSVLRRAGFSVSPNIPSSQFTQETSARSDAAVSDEGQQTNNHHSAHTSEFAHRWSVVPVFLKHADQFKSFKSVARNRWIGHLAEYISSPRRMI